MVKLLSPEKANALWDWAYQHAELRSVYYRKNVIDAATSGHPRAIKILSEEFSDLIDVDQFPDTRYFDLANFEGDKHAAKVLGDIALEEGEYQQALICYYFGLDSKCEYCMEQILFIRRTHEVFREDMLEELHKKPYVVVIKEFEDRHWWYFEKYGRWNNGDR